ncbi:MAG: hypothetical protein ACRYGL_18420 [Janthinobacterium lividum]
MVDRISGGAAPSPLTGATPASGETVRQRAPSGSPPPSRGVLEGLAPRGAEARSGSGPALPDAGGPRPGLRALPHKEIGPGAGGRQPSRPPPSEAQQNGANALAIARSEALKKGREAMAEAIEKGARATAEAAKIPQTGV